MNMNQHSLRPVGHRLLIEVIDDPNQNLLNPAGIFLPEHFLDLPISGVVKGIGAKCCEFKGQIGDIVAFDKVSGNIVKDFPNLLLIHEKNLLGIYAC